MKELEDPLKLLDQAVADMQSDLIKMRQAAAQVPTGFSHHHLMRQFWQTVSAANSESLNAAEPALIWQCPCRHGAYLCR